jgi:two-component system sensor histidine kinase RegB
VRLRTLILLRWMAIFGQIATITIADRYFGLILPLGLCFLAVGASIIANLISIYLFPENKRLSEPEAVLMLLFDMMQLAFLLFVTGGLTNPFALLVLAPVTISASTLQLRATVFLGATAILFISLTAAFNLPLRLADGTALAIPPLFAFGFWLSIVVGILFLGLYARRVATEIRAMGEALLATQMALAREQKLTDLGGVVAAAAHELGTPLATIKLVSSELMDELEDKPDALGRRQADPRSGRPLPRHPARHGAGRKGRPAAAPGPAGGRCCARRPSRIATRGKALVFQLQPGPGGSDAPAHHPAPPEVIHGLRNLVQNAVDFATSTVWVEAEWTDRAISIRIVDNGEGYPPNVIGRIGDPFVRSRRSEQDRGQRPEYEGMGLGLFIAKTLLERSGAELTFANAADPFLSPEERPERCGAVVEAVWPLDRLKAPRG